MAATETTKDDAYRAVGRYVVEFSRMVFHMRLAIEQRLKADDPIIAKLALGESFANQICEAFFAICEHVADLDGAETKVGNRLRNLVRQEIARRNDYAHGDWWVGFGEDPSLWRVKPQRKEGAFKVEDIPVADLDQAADQVYALREQVSEFGDLCLESAQLEFIWQKPVRVRDIFRLQKQTNRVLRDGPLASERSVEYS